MASASNPFNMLIQPAIGKATQRLLNALPNFTAAWGRLQLSGGCRAPPQASAMLQSNKFTADLLRH